MRGGRGSVEGWDICEGRRGGRPVRVCAHKRCSVPPEPQVRSIANHVRPDRQSKSFPKGPKVAHPTLNLVLTPSALLFSATFRKRVERLCRDVLTDPVRIVVGDLGEANTDITQVCACAVCVADP